MIKRQIKNGGRTNLVTSKKASGLSKDNLDPVDKVVAVTNKVVKASREDKVVADKKVVAKTGTRAADRDNVLTVTRAVGKVETKVVEIASKAVDKIETSLAGSGLIILTGIRAIKVTNPVGNDLTILTRGRIKRIKTFIYPLPTPGK